MRFTDGFWLMRPGVEAHYARQAYALAVADDALVVTAPTKVIETRGDTLNLPVLTVTVAPHAPGVVRVRIEHHTGGGEALRFETAPASGGSVAVEDDGTGVVTSGDLVARVSPGAPWRLEFASGGRVLTSSGHRSQAWIRLAPDAAVDAPPVGLPLGGAYVHEQLDLGVGTQVFGLGERFGPLVKNGQTVEIWNADGGTSSEQAYKNVPFYLTDAGYGVLVDEPGHVSFEVGSEAVQRVQFSVEGESLQYFVIAGDSPAQILERYTALTGRPPEVPAWSWGTWLSTSFTTDYDEATVTSFLDGMRDRDLPLSVFHFDCSWMRELQWTDFVWDERVFPDPEGMLRRLHDRGLRVSAWINPYIAQQSPLFQEAAAAGHLLRRPDGSVWQWDLWQAGMGVVDFTSEAATTWFQEHVRRLLRQGVDAIKTDFGERIPLDVVFADGSDPKRMHNLYAERYNAAVHAVLDEERPGEAVVFARSATAGGQRHPVHWGGDSTSTFASMAETLRGGLSLSLSGFGYWSHDIGGFEGTPDAAVFKRWVAFGLLSSHSRFHGSDSYRVPWLFDDGDEAAPDSAVSVTRRFATLKNRLAPYLIAAGREAAATGMPVMRPMVLAFPEDPTARPLDRQYLLGPDLLVAPVFSAEGDVELYLPAGTWTHLLTGERVQGPTWRRERHGFDSLPLYVREGAVLPIGARDDRPDTDHLDGLTLVAFPGADGVREVRVGDAVFAVETSDDEVHATGPEGRWSLRLGGAQQAADGGAAHLRRTAEPVPGPVLPD
ncbi:alpha-xylosidase [Amnibacterium kyonggiense]|uniref:alpha-D-xyloside xylohydrolase n=1 Tax=Amnibacterium kyonggiense TaxID=595671 RepID=A0A4R7FS47_9MICO|nr:alpha-xylosidase [Amnibacterium kyonggiense]TDS80672.1 alpha-D-xyloside xylohydrolase [Amnibacterium kyonggiense]